MFRIIKNDLIKYFIFCGILLVIDGVWKILEYIEFGKTMPSISDTIIGIAFAFSLYKNLKSMIIMILAKKNIDMIVYEKHLEQQK